MRQLRRSMFRLRPGFILMSMLVVAALMTFFNVRMSRRLTELEQQIQDSVNFKNQSAAEVHRLWENYGQELALQAPMPDDAQTRVEETMRAPAEIPPDVLPPIDWSKPFPNTNIDIGVPVAGEDKKLVEFFRVLGNSIEEFRRLSESSQGSVKIRAVVTRYSQDDSSVEFRQRLAEEAVLPLDQVLFVKSEEPKFHRAYAINTLHSATKRDERSVLAIVDVDMDVGPRFIYNSLTVVGKGRFYFPIVFSEYRPSNTRLVEQYLGMQHKYSPHRGLWRGFGYGMYAISGADVSNYKLDESFQGWGGEDTEFFKRVQKTAVKVVREKEYDLVHRWHAKYCDLDGFVEPDKLRACIKSRNVMEGSTFGQFVLKTNASKSSMFRFLLRSSRYLSWLVAYVMESKVYEALIAKPMSKRGAYLEVIQALAARKYERGQGRRIDDKRATGILIGVTASRQTFPTRVAEVVQTWAKNLPAGVYVRFYVGELVDDSVPYKSGSPEDFENLARQAGIVDKSTIGVMTGIQDDEYPLVQKAIGVLKHMEDAARSLKQTSHEIRWFFDVDDDTYVNVQSLQDFLSKRDIRQHNYFGKRGMGSPKDREMLRRGGLEKPYCMGGTGILMGRKTFDVLVDNVRACVVDAYKTQAIVYDDVVFGMCLQRHVGIGCWEDQSYESDTFAHNFRGSDDFPRPRSLRKTITLHPHKTPGMMTRTHERFVRYVFNGTKSLQRPDLLGFSSG